MEANTCAATGCDRTVPVWMLMCGRHWRMLPDATKKAVRATYQAVCEEGTADQHAAYLAAVGTAVREVAAREQGDAAKAGSG